MSSAVVGATRVPASAAAEAPPSISLAHRAQYFALRAWALLMDCFPVDLNLRTAQLLGTLWWLLSPKHRERALANLRPALGDRYSEQQLRDIARRSFQHFTQLYLVETGMLPRLISEWSWARHVELGRLGPALRLLLARRGCILLTPHFGSYELLGYTICRLGIPLTAIFRPLDNDLVNDYLIRTRKSGGLELLMKKGVSERAAAVLDAGGALCFIADQDAGRKGLFVDFFGRKASTYKSIGLLAMAKRVPIVVGYAARIGGEKSGSRADSPGGRPDSTPRFRYRIDVERVIHPEEWDSQDDPLLWITQTFSHAMEAAIRRYPEQYLWVHRRWKHRPKEENTAAQLLSANRPGAAR